MNSSHCHNNVVCRAGGMEGGFTKFLVHMPGCLLLLLMLFLSIFLLFSACVHRVKKMRTDWVHVDEPSCPLLSILVAAEAKASINFIIQVCSLQSLLCGVFTPEKVKGEKYDYCITTISKLLLVLLWVWKHVTNVGCTYFRLSLCQCHCHSDSVSKDLFLFVFPMSVNGKGAIGSVPRGNTN